MARKANHPQNEIDASDLQTRVNTLLKALNSKKRLDITQSSIGVRVRWRWLDANDELSADNVFTTIRTCYNWKEAMLLVQGIHSGMQVMIAITGKRDLS